ncbi:hydrolase [Oceanobacillus halotolerans]|uniref:hydrolase n=1 Tax=Oceanobacillus halotolerans TaxID=2663380 RepID=UPI0013D910A7|nr:hydrolase [Oceanobacillus halotolerans]
MDKKKFYVNVGSREISQIPYDNNDQFVIYATDDEVRILREKMDTMYNADIRAFFRSHVPIKPYHEDDANDDYDADETRAFQMLYELGDETTKQHIKEMDILPDKHL